VADDGGAIDAGHEPEAPVGPVTQGRSINWPFAGAASISPILRLIQHLIGAAIDTQIG
jgi:hypothetical protein